MPSGFKKALTTRLLSKTTTLRKAAVNQLAHIIGRQRFGGGCGCATFQQTREPAAGYTPQNLVRIFAFWDD